MPFIFQDLSRGPSEFVLEVPYLCNTPYDGQDWLNYPERQHMTLEHIRYQEYRRYEPAKVASVLQNWLMFGLLRAILPAELGVTDDDFVHTNDDDGTRTATIATLPSLLQRWYALEAQLPLEQRRTRFEAQSKILQEAKLHISLLEGFPNNWYLPGNLFPPLPRRVSTACAFLGYLLSEASRAVLNPKGEFDSQVNVAWGEGCVFMEHMEIQGWCPFIVAGVQKQLGGFLLMHYLATLGPPLVKRNHRSCTDNRCKAAAFLPKIVQHVSHDCSCSHHGMDMEVLAKLIREQKTPVVRMASEHGDKPKIILEDAAKAGQYVAISHVWSDGLGNPEENSMPQCQLMRIQQAVRSLYDTPLADEAETGGDCDNESIARPGWFWIDTLCVPNGQHYPELNGLALPRMKEIYVQADKVLVLDAEVTACGTTTDAQVVLARVCLSNWSRRLWTFQEGYFAKSLLFLVGTSAISIADLLARAAGADAHLPPPLNTIAARRWTVVEANFRGLFNRSCGPAQDFESGAALFNEKPKEGTVVAVLQEVRSRVSTFDADEAGCLAYLLNVDTVPIYRAPVEERMKELFKLLDARGAELTPPGCIPPGVLLLPGRRIDIDGYRWAPRSIMMGPEGSRFLISHPFEIPSGQPGAAEPMFRPSGVLTKHGLRIQFPGFLLGKVREHVSMGSSLIVDTKSPDTLQESPAGAEGNLPVSPAPLPAWRLTYSKDLHDPPWKDIAPSGERSETLAVIVFHYGPLWRPTSEGLLVRVRQELKDGPLAVSRVCRMLVGGTPEYDDQSWMREPSKRLQGEWRPVTQLWCVD